VNVLQAEGLVFEVMVEDTGLPREVELKNMVNLPFVSKAKLHYLQAPEARRKQAV
jgi:hypothetical protein